MALVVLMRGYGMGIGYGSGRHGLLPHLGSLSFFFLLILLGFSLSYLTFPKQGIMGLTYS